MSCPERTLKVASDKWDALIDQMAKWEAKVSGAEKSQRVEYKWTPKRQEEADNLLKGFKRLLPCWNHKKQDQLAGKRVIAKLLEYVGDRNTVDLARARRAYEEAWEWYPTETLDDQLDRAFVSESILNIDHELLQRDPDAIAADSPEFQQMVADYRIYVEGGPRSVHSVLENMPEPEGKASKQHAAERRKIYEALVNDVGYVWDAYRLLLRTSPYDPEDPDSTQGFAEQMGYFARKLIQFADAAEELGAEFVGETRDIVREARLLYDVLTHPRGPTATVLREQGWDNYSSDAEMPDADD